MSTSLESTASALSIHVTFSDEATTVALFGGADPSTQRKLEVGLAAVLRTSFDELIVDLSQLSHLDATAHRVLLDIQARALRQGRTLTFRDSARSTIPTDAA